MGDDKREKTILPTLTDVVGTTNYSIEEIINYEKKMNKIYILGFYDCRHYVNCLTLWSLNTSIPIWNLEMILLLILT